MLRNGHLLPFSDVLDEALIQVLSSLQVLPEFNYLKHSKHRLVDDVFILCLSRQLRGSLNDPWPGAAAKKHPDDVIQVLHKDLPAPLLKDRRVYVSVGTWLLISRVRMHVVIEHSLRVRLEQGVLLPAHPSASLMRRDLVPRSCVVKEVDTLIVDAHLIPDVDGDHPLREGEGSPPGRGSPDALEMAQLVKLARVSAHIDPISIVILVLLLGS